MKIIIENPIDETIVEPKIEVRFLDNTRANKTIAKKVFRQSGGAKVIILVNIHTGKKTATNGKKLIPVKGEATPKRGEATLNRGDATPNKGNATPNKGNATPNRGNATLNKSNATPNKGDTLNGGNTTLNGGNATLNGGNATPNRGNATPVSGILIKEHYMTTVKSDKVFIMMAVGGGNGGYIPGSDGDFDDWQENLKSIAWAKKVTFEIPDAAFDNYILLQTAWDAAYALVLNKNTASHSNFVSKDTARFNFEKEIRSFVKKWIRGNNNVTAEDLSDMQIPEIKTIKSKFTDVEGIPAGLELSNYKQLDMKFHFWIEVGEGNKRINKKPANVAKIEIAYLIVPAGDTTVHSVNECLPENHFFTGKTPAKRHFSESDKGKKGYAWCRYIGKNGSIGNWTELPTPISVWGNQ